MTAARRAWEREPTSWAGYGNAYEWRAFRKRWFGTHPHDCVIRYDDICLGTGTILDHKDGCDYTINRCNPEWIEGIVCRPCHNRKTGKQGHAALMAKRGGYKQLGQPSEEW
jgi:hypothetical protein